jgi:hypothetical protein
LQLVDLVFVVCLYGLCPLVSVLLGCHRRHRPRRRRRKLQIQGMVK